MNTAQYLKGIDSWAALQRKLAGADNKTKGDIFEFVTQKFLQFKPEFASKLKHVWLYKEIPSALSKKLNLPAADQGIDLIAETIEGEYWSIQCKYVSDENQTLGHGKLGTFGSLSFLIAKALPTAWFVQPSTTMRRFTGVSRKSVSFCLTHGIS